VLRDGDRVHAGLILRPDLAFAAGLVLLDLALALGRIRDRLLRGHIGSHGKRKEAENTS